MIRRRLRLLLGIRKSPGREPDPIQYSRVVELPYGLSHDTYEVGVGFLAARNTLQTDSLNVHRKLLSGTYEQVLTHQPFMLRGHLVETYSDKTTLIDNQLGMLVQFDSVDMTLPSSSLEDALMNDWLLFVNGEIISLFNPTLVAEACYRVFGIRGRYDTQRQTHANTSEVFVVRRSLLPAYVETSPSDTMTWKLQPVNLGVALALDEVTPVSKTLNYRGQRPWCPKNLRVNGVRSNPVWNGSSDLIVTWSNVSPAPSDLPSTILEIIGGENVLITETLAPGVKTRTLTPAELSSINGFSEFVVRLWHIRPGGWKSLLSTELIVLSA